MARVVSIVGVLLIVLSSCTIFPLVGGPQVSGNLSDGWPEGSNLALVGLSSDGQINYSNQTRIVDPNIFDGYVLALPEPAAEGIYQIVGYNDLNKNNMFDAEEVTGRSTNKYVIYSRTDRQVSFLGNTFVVRRGWNGYDASVAATEENPNPYQADTYTGFDVYLQ